MDQEFPGFWGTGKLDIYLGVKSVNRNLYLCCHGEASLT